MKRTSATIYAVFCTLLMAGGFLVLFYFAWQDGIGKTVELFIAVAVSFALAPTLHELGHIAFAELADMRLVYAKFFCFRIYEKEGKLRFGFASPFAADQTQTMPRKGGNMPKRAMRYTLGGLALEGTVTAALAVTAIILGHFGIVRYAVLGLLPYTAYLFLLNAVPAEYASGKTDALVCMGVKRGYDAEKNMLAAMEIQGSLNEGKSFAEIDQALYFSQPQLPEDEPLYAVMLDLKYRYCLEKGELDRAADCLNRLTQAQAYLSEGEVEKIAAELLYMHALRGDLESAEACGTLCREYLKSEDASAKRILAAYSKAAGKTEAVEPLIGQAEALLEREQTDGVKKFERILLSRLA